MTNYSLINSDQTTWNKAYQIYEEMPVYKLRRHALDIATDMTTVVAADTADLVPLGAGDVVVMVFANVITASTVTSSTIHIGDSGSATRYKTDLSCTATGFTFSTTACPYGYTTTGALRITLGTTAPSDGVIDIGAIVAVIPNIAAE